MEDKQAQAAPDGGRHSPMSLDVYSIAGFAAVAVADGVVGLRLVLDESSLRRKRLIADR